jgi:hypothetical protein
MGGLLRLRVVVEDPPADVAFQMQRGRVELVRASRASRTELAFDFTVRVGRRPGGEPNFLGPFTQGPATGRFVYVNSGTLAGQTDSCWTRRAKVPLGGITWTLIERARSANVVLESRIAGTSRDGGPACASVPLRAAGWRIVRG